MTNEPGMSFGINGKMAWRSLFPFGKSGKLEDGNWKLGIGSRKLEIENGNWKMENRKSVTAKRK
jgi:hypothetical protein